MKTGRAPSQISFAILQLPYIVLCPKVLLCAPAHRVRCRHGMAPRNPPEEIANRYSLTRPLRALYTNDADLHIEYIPAGAVVATTGRRCLGGLIEVLWGTGAAADVLIWTREAFKSRLHLQASLPSTVLSEGRLLYAA